MMIQALLFDLDNTLVDRAEAHRKYWEDFLLRYPEETGGAERNALLSDLIRQDDSGYRCRKDYFAWVSTALPGMAWDAEAFWKDYRSRLASFIQPNTKVTRVVELLGRCYRLAVVSNGSSAGQRSKLEQAGLASLLKVVCISEECGVEKPSPKIFLMALNELGSSPSEAMFIGDDPIRDIGGAARAGCRTCWISHNRQFPGGLAQPDLSIPAVTALPQALGVAQGNGQIAATVC